MNLSWSDIVDAEDKDIVEDLDHLPSLCYNRPSCSLFGRISLIIFFHSHLCHFFIFNFSFFTLTRLELECCLTTENSIPRIDIENNFLMNVEDTHENNNVEEEKLTHVIFKIININIIKIRVVKHFTLNEERILEWYGC